MEYAWASLFLVTLAVGWILTLLSLPGNWLMLLAAVLYAYLLPPETAVSIGWGVVFAMAVLALLGELLEFAAGAMGATRQGGSKRGAILAALGAVPGAILGAIVGSLIPIVLQIVAVVVFAGLGALGGAMLGEWWKGRTLGESWRVGQGAFWGRILGSLAKVMIASILFALGAGAVIWQLVASLAAGTA